MSRESNAHREKTSATAPVRARSVDRRWVIGVLGAGAAALGGGWYAWSLARHGRAGNHPEPSQGTKLPVTLSPALFVAKTGAA